MVQDAARSHNNKLDKLNEILDEIERRPTVITDDEFPSELSKLGKDINEFHETVRNATGDHSIFQKVENIRDREKEISRTLSGIDESLNVVQSKTQGVELNLDHIDENIDEADER